MWACFYESISYLSLLLNTFLGHPCVDKNLSPRRKRETRYLENSCKQSEDVRLCWSKHLLTEFTWFVLFVHLYWSITLFLEMTYQITRLVGSEVGSTCPGSCSCCCQERAWIYCSVGHGWCSWQAHCWTKTHWHRARSSGTMPESYHRNGCCYNFTFA